MASIAGAGEATSDRIANLDLIRGIAVLGILAVNITGFAGTTGSAVTPHLPRPASAVDEAAFAAVFVLFEGKMRALFTLLFGASMVLFIDRAEAHHRDGEMLQLRRLAWLALFGYLHFALLWWGDILLIYAVLAVVCLPLRRMQPGLLALTAVAFFLLWHGIGMAVSWGDLTLDHAVLTGTASAAEATQHRAALNGWSEAATRELPRYQLGWLPQVAERISTGLISRPSIILSSLGETAPLIALGMALYRSGFFGAGWSRRSLHALAAWGIALGCLLTLCLLGYAWGLTFPAPTMFAFILYWTALPHLLMALGYLAALRLLAPRLLTTRIGQRLTAAGRMAFSNYIGTSLVMCTIFYGWGAGRNGHYGPAVQLLFVPLGWGLMLAWSAPWLRHFRQGPLEWAWRCLTEWRFLPLRRA